MRLRLSRDIRRIVRTILEKFGVPWLTPRRSLNDLDRKLEKYLDYKRGFFIEAGGNDGENQSNTYYLEFGKLWTGILVEAIPELYDKCKICRKKSIVFNYALVSPEFSQETLTLHYANLMSVAEGAMPEEALREHIKMGLDCQGITKSYDVEVPAETLATLLDKCNVKEIDFFSLDVEGGELSVLQGLGLAKYRPKLILVEARYFDEVDNFLKFNGYLQLEKFSGHDYLYGDASKGFSKDR